MRNRGLVGRRVVTTALAISLAAGFLAVGAAVVTASAQPSVTCTFNGKPGPVSITGVVPGTSTVSISCTGTSGLSLATAEASPLGGFVIPPATATGEADIATLTPLKESPPGTYTATFAVPANFSASDPNAVSSSLARSVQRGPRGLRHRGHRHLGPLAVTGSGGGLGVLDPDHPAECSDAGDEFEHGDRR